MIFSAFKVLPKCLQDTLSFGLLSRRDICYRTLVSSGRSGNKPHLAKKRKGLGKTTNEVATKGFIGDTKYDILSPLFQKYLPDGITMVDLLSKTTKLHDSLIRNHGVVEGTSKWKAIWLYANALLEGREVKNPGWVSTGKADRWPNKLSHLRPLAHFIIDNIHNKDEEHKVTELRRVMLTLSKLNRVCTANKTIDLSKSKLKFKLDPKLVSRFEQFARNKLAAVREEITPTDLTINFYLSPNNGPNGMPMQDSALAESAALRRNNKLHDAFKELCITTGNTHFYDFFEQCSKRMYRLDDTLRVKLRKITSIPDKGNKSRVIAICDFWTQSVLTSIENKVVSVTRQIFHENCCYDSHSEGWSKVLGLPAEIQALLASLDAKDWTENLPASLQYIVVKALFGQKIANSWKVLAVDCEWYVPGMARPFKYGKGQGMGTKGSFAIAQLTDLLFVEFILEEEYPSVSSPFFMKVGDDLIVHDPQLRLSNRYEQIGVPVNLTKSKFKTSYGNFMEFVSRNSWNGNDYSIISPTLIPKFRGNDFYAATFYSHLKERGAYEGDINELLDINKPVLPEGNLPSEAYLERRRRIYMIICLLGHMEGSHILDIGNSPWNSYTNEELLDFLEIWILSVLGDFIYVVLSDYMSEASINSRNKITDLVGEMSLTPIDSTVSSPADLFFKKAIHNGLSLEEAITLQKSLILVGEMDNRFQQGLENIDSISSEDLQLFEASENDQEMHVRPQAIRHVLNLVDKVGQMTKGYKTLRRLSFFDKANTNSSIHLHKHLYKIIGLKESPLNLITGQYTPSNGGPIQIDPQLLKGYCSLFKFDVMLGQISNRRSSNSSTLRLHLTTPTENLVSSQQEDI